MLKYIYFFHLHLLRIYDYPLSLCDLGMKILSGFGGLCKTFNGINNHVNPQGIGPLNTPLIKFSHFHYLLCCEYCLFFPFFPCDLGVKIPIGRGGLCKTSMRR